MRIFSRFFWASGLMLWNGSGAGIVSFSVFDSNDRYVVSDKWHVISGTESLTLPRRFIILYLLHVS